MPSFSKKVFVVLATTIQHNNEIEKFKETYEGTYKSKGEIEILSFFKKDVELGEIDYRLIIRPNKVHLTRSGKFSLQQRFVLNDRTESVYKHPYGNLLMLTETKSIRHQKMLSNHEGEVEIIYDVTMNDEENKEHHLVVTYMEEK